MPPDPPHGRETIALVVRTLLAAGGEIVESHDQIRHTELSVDLPNIFGTRSGFLIAVTDQPGYSAEEIASIRAEARRAQRSALLGAATAGDDWQLVDDLLSALGGAVPSWRALESTYEDALVTASRNRLPHGMSGEPWALFEDLVADGLEYTLGRRVRRLGGRKRGRKVSDMLAQLPDGRILVVDAKATETALDASLPNLRPLQEYTANQRRLQHGQNEVFGALIVNSRIQQNATTLDGVSRGFYAAVSVPVSFLEATALARLVSLCRETPTVRNGIAWNEMFAGGLVTQANATKVVESARLQRVARDGSP